MLLLTYSPARHLTADVVHELRHASIIEYPHKPDLHIRGAEYLFKTPYENVSPQQRRIAKEQAYWHLYSNTFVAHPDIGAPRWSNGITRRMNATDPNTQSVDKLYSWAKDLLGKVDFKLQGTVTGRLTTNAPVQGLLADMFFDIDRAVGPDMTSINFLKSRHDHAPQVMVIGGFDTRASQRAMEALGDLRVDIESSYPHLTMDFAVLEKRIMGGFTLDSLAQYYAGGDPSLNNPWTGRMRRLAVGELVMDELVETEEPPAPPPRSKLEKSLAQSKAAKKALRPSPLLRKLVGGL